MKAIIMASGKGTRMAPLTDTIPKPMLKVLDKNLIEWKLERLPKEIDHIIMIVSYLREAFIDYFGDSWNGIPITYVIQDPINGTGGGIALCKDLVDGRTLIVSGDDIYEKEDMEKLVQYDYAMLVCDQGEEGLKKKGQVVEKGGLFVGINEGDIQTGIPSSLINTGAYTISKEYFTYPLVKWSPTEYGFPQTLAQMKDDYPIHIIRAREWIQITAPEDLEIAEKKLRS
jgi:UDP-N-acetylglucosamine diphosphorylase / glucose-1-phosphate thymidylyltransferase / UDP-N-acetylgalactosamine diphosphorylase / glucosamine-1-phosphate N-acetyltransferase / galactosamine-1-phosphate N-acetyltransferase